mgnify:FL=1
MKWILQKSISTGKAKISRILPTMISGRAKIRHATSVVASPLNEAEVALGAAWQVSHSQHLTGNEDKFASSICLRSTRILG